MPLDFRAFLRAAGVVAALALPAACGSSADTEVVSRADTSSLPTTRWDHRTEAPAWTRATLSALRSHGTPMLESTPADIAVFCPGFETATTAERGAFWAGLFSALARYESGWRPDAAGAGGRYRGLLQIFPQSARYHGCAIDDAGELYDGRKNLSCAVRIAAKAVARDGVVAGGPGNWGGVAADWPPMRDNGKRAEIAAFTSAQSYCRK